VNRLFVLLFILFLPLSLLAFNPNQATARRGCCSHHGGVGNCQCNDGTPLSPTCAPYYPQCKKSSTSEKPNPPPSTQPTANAFSQKKTKGSVFYCVVINVHDGDTLACQESTSIFKIRLGGIDAPELKQAYGGEAQKFTSNMVSGKMVKVLVTDVDRYKRLVADIVIDNQRLNYEIVRNGWAWFYRQYSKDLNLPVLENQARTARKGLWADLNPQAPWNFRKKNK